MRIATTGITVPEGKHKYEDPVIIALAEKFSPKKVTWFYAEIEHDGQLLDFAFVVGGNKYERFILHC